MEGEYRIVYLEKIVKIQEKQINECHKLLQDVYKTQEKILKMYQRELERIAKIEKTVADLNNGFNSACGAIESLLKGQMQIQTKIDPSKKDNGTTLEIVK